jgi:hypothetical protein
VCGYGLSILSVSYEVCFLVGVGKKKIQGSMAGCVENYANIVGVVRFHFFT